MGLPSTKRFLANNWCYATHASLSILTMRNETSPIHIIDH